MENNPQSGSASCGDPSERPNPRESGNRNGDQNGGRCGAECEPPLGMHPCECGLPAGHLGGHESVGGHKWIGAIAGSNPAPSRVLCGVVDPHGSGATCDRPAGHAERTCEGRCSSGRVWWDKPAVPAAPPPVVVDVKGCDDCPCAVAVGQGFTVCQLLAPAIGCDTPPAPSNRTPEWCPLPVFPVTLRVRR